MKTVAERVREGRLELAQGLQAVRVVEKELAKRRMALGLIVRRLNKTMSLRQIAEMAGVSHNTIRDWIKAVEDAERRSERRGE